MRTMTMALALLAGAAGALAPCAAQAQNDTRASAQTRSAKRTEASAFRTERVVLGGLSVGLPSDAGWTLKRDGALIESTHTSGSQFWVKVLPMRDADHAVLLENTITDFVLRAVHDLPSAQKHVPKTFKTALNAHGVGVTRGEPLGLSASRHVWAFVDVPGREAVLMVGMYASDALSAREIGALLGLLDAIKPGG